MNTDKKTDANDDRNEPVAERVINATQEYLDELSKLDQSDRVVSFVTEHVEWHLAVLRHACTLSPEDAERYLKWKDHEARVRWPEIYAEKSS